VRRRYCRLALAQGKGIGEFLRSTPAAELTEWLAYFDLEPPEEERADVRWAIWLAMYANAHRAQGDSEHKPDEFLEMLPWRRAPDVEPDEVDLDRLRSKIMQLNAAFKGGGIKK